MPSIPNKSQKLILLLDELKQPNGAFADDLIEKFELDERSLRRYICDLKEIDIPVEKKRDTKPDGRKEQRFWVSANYQRSGVHITLLEWISLRFGRSFFSFLNGTNFAADLDSALDNLNPIIMGKSGGITDNLEKKFFNINESIKDHSQQSELIDDIMTCLLHQNPADAFYARIGAPIKKYRLHPYTLVTFRQGLYLFAYDLEAGIIKTFAVERFQNFKRNRREHFEIPIEYTPQQIIEDSFGIIKGVEVCDVELQFSRVAAPYIQERMWHHSQVMAAADNGEVILKLHVGIAHELISWILSFGPDIKVLNPPFLIDLVRKKHQQSFDRYKEMYPEHTEN